MAFAMHGAALWLLEGPDPAPEDSSRIPPLRIAIEAAPTGESVTAEPGKVVLPPDMQHRERSPAYPGDQIEQADAGDHSGDTDAVPTVNPFELLRNLAPAAKAPTARFRRQPATHPVFKPQRLVRAGEPPASWSRGIWRRSAVDDETRFKTRDGRSVWIRRYDNGDIQVCERARDDPMDQWDDHLPFVCER